MNPPLEELSQKYPFIFSSLNPQQQQAAAHIDGPVLILAGAGSGKTKTLTHRIAFLIASGIQPDNILAITFTNKAAGEIKERVKALLTEYYEYTLPGLPMLGTFHSVCLRILRQEADKLGFGKNFIIYDSADQLSIIKSGLQAMDLDPKKFNPQSMHGKISKLKSELIDPDEFAQTAKAYPEKILSQIYTHYQQELKKNNAMDFDDLIMFNVVLFRKHPEILHKYQQIFKYVLVDEYQDTNRAQYKWVNALAHEHRNLAVVGDDGQSIYKWRAADIRNILNFERDYPEAKVVILEQNYRSTQNILSAANSIIANNKENKPKNLWTENPEGEQILAKELPNEREEASYVVQQIQNYLKKEQDLSGFTILYRTHANSRVLEEAMIRHGLPYKIIGGIKFYQRREVKDILAYLRLALNPNDSVSLERIYNVPVRGLGEASFDKFRETELQLTQLFENPALLEDKAVFQKKKLQTFLELISLIKEIHEQARKVSPSEIIKIIFNKTDYQKFILDGTSEGEDRWENVKELFTATKKYDTLPNEEALERFLEEVTLMQETDNLEENTKTINLMTIHSSKGLEFPVVFVTGMEEGVFPHSRALFDPKELEEERRLCYVAITRAQKKLHMSFCRQRMTYGNVQFNAPSRFLFEIPKHLVQMKPLNDIFEDYEEVIRY